MDRSEFANPGAQYRGVALWMLNDKLEREEIARQLKGIHEAGWGAVITRTFNGLRTPYLSEEWMDITQVSIDVARECGMKVWLQAGYMPSGIPDLPPDQAHKVLLRKRKEEAAEAGEKLLCQEGDWAYYLRTLNTVLDLLNPQAVKEYLDKAYRVPWGDRFGKEFGQTVETIWVDEPHFRPPLLPWNDRLPRVFKRQWGYSLLESIPALFAGDGDGHKVRNHYWRVVLDMLLSAYFKQVGKWCAEHNVRFSGHLMGEDTLQGQIGWTASTMPCYEYMQLPGIDHLTLSLTWPSGNNFVMTPKQCSSASNQLGHRQILAEMYGVSTQGISFEDRKWIGDWIMLMGINYRCYHGAFYSIRGQRKRVYVPHLSYQQPWWPDNRLVADYFGRLSYAMSQGQYRADVLLLHPVESGFCTYDPTFIKQPHDRVNEPPAIRVLNQTFAALSDNMLKIHRGFEYGDELLMGKYGKVSPKGLTVGKMTYGAVILPSVITLRKTTVDLLKRFIRSGGTVLAAGDLPTRIDGKKTRLIESLNSKLVKVKNDPTALKKALDKAVPPAAEVVARKGSAQHVWLHERKIDGGRVFFLINPTRDMTVEADLRIRGAGALERWDLRTGQVTPIAQKSDGKFTVTRLSFPPAASHLIVLNETAKAAAVAFEKQGAVRSIALPGKFRVTRHSPNALTLDFCRFRKGDGEWSEVIPVIAVQEQLEREGYAGPVTLQFRFTAEARPASARIVIEDAPDYGVTVNGQAVSYAGLPYYVDRSFLPVDVTEQLRAGENVVEVTRRFEPTARARFSLASLWQTAAGVELESLYLIGDFAVKARVSPREQKAKCDRLEPDFVVAAESGESSGQLAVEGYPFFAGRISLSDTVELEAPRDGERAFLELPTLDAALAKVRVNGKEAGAVLWQPYRVEITPLVRDGANRVEIEFVTTLRSLLGPHHRPAGEPDDTWSDAWAARAAGSDWYRRRNSPEVPWTDDYFVCHLGISGKAVIEYVSASR
jgi:hypothetical protein